MWRAHSFFFPTPRRLRRPNHPNLFLLGLNSFHGILSYFTSKARNVEQGKGKSKKARQRDAGEGTSNNFHHDRGQGRGVRGCGGVSRGPGPGQNAPRIGLEPAILEICSLEVPGTRLEEPAPVPAYRGCYSPHGCGEAGERLGSLCAIEVEGRKRRPPTEVGGLGLEFRSLGFMV